MFTNLKIVRREISDGRSSRSLEYNDPTISKRFVVGIDRAKMRLYDCEQSAQDDILDSGQDEEYTNEEPKPKKSFDGFKF